MTAQAQTIPVAALTKGSVQLFAAGQYVLLGNEVCLVTAVNTAASTLSVTRGAVYPAAAHPAGERVAAAVTAYPGTFRMDMTDRCPAVDLGDGHGAQTWVQWRVRDTLARVADPVWDGVYVDLCGSDQSHIVGPSNPTRSIDYLRNNTLPSDGYAAFDAAWNAGQVAFDNGVRTGLGTRIYFTNEFATDYAVRNGTIFEHFPFMRNVGYPWEWATTMFGPRDTGKGDRIGTVQDWMSKCAEPNLTTLLEYETVAGTPEYQKMRYGLCSSLIAGAHFSYENPVNGSKVFPWMDEYDNAGAGGGYLGQPIGEAYPVRARARAAVRWRRDFQGGMALVNASASAVSVGLGRTYRKIKGTQVPTVNDGSLATSVTLQPKDGLVLIRDNLAALHRSGHRRDRHALEGVVSTTGAVAADPSGEGRRPARDAPRG